MGCWAVEATTTAGTTAGEAAPGPAKRPPALSPTSPVSASALHRRRTPAGCTAILFDEPATAGADYDGSAPGEMLGVMLQPVSPVDRIHGILLSGGGPMGLGAVAGVVRYLESRAVGYSWGPPGLHVRIVVGAVIDDLSVGDGPYPARS